jgi:4-hydroxy-tetrahydrodipicolinate synthase
MGSLATFDETAARIRGPLIPVLAPFKDNEDLDIDACCTWVDWLIQRGMGVFWTTHGTTHFDCLTDREILDLTKALADTIQGRAVLIASSAYRWSTQECIRFVDQAAHQGVDVVKLQINWPWKPSQDQVLDHYRRIAATSPIPLFAYTLASPGGAPGIGPDLLERIIEIPQFIGLKNDTDDFYGEAEFLRIVRQTRGVDRFLPVTGGSMSSFLFGYQFGARAFGTVIGWFAPHVATEFHNELCAGNRERAVEIITQWQEPAWDQWKRVQTSTAWAWGHAVLTHMGFFTSRKMRFPLATTTDAAFAQARRFLCERGIIDPRDSVSGPVD